MISLIVGLGNPGEKYKNTRHNLGFILVDDLCHAFRPDRKFKAEIAEYSHSSHKIILLKPQTYMNLSGESVQAVSSFYQIDPKEILVLHDELDLPFGTVRLKFAGGEGGHNGLKSISQHLGTKDYARLRLGIGKPEAGNQIPIENWVLQRFTSADSQTLENTIKTGRQAIDQILKDGFSKAQNLVNAL